MARGVDGREVFTDDTDRRNFLLAALHVKTETPFSILAYCLMPNHFHFAIRVSQVPLSQIMHRLLTRYVIGFNTRHSRQGHLFQARYKSCLCLDDTYLVALIPYIHMNPVRAGMVFEPGEWPWSSYREYIGTASATFADTELYNSALGLEGASRTDPHFEPWPGSPSPLVRQESESIDSIDAIAQAAFPDDLMEIRSGSRRRALTEKKLLIAEKAAEKGHSLASIAAWMNCGPSAIHRLLQLNK
jgi:REP element-mobilizing transposase RayT